MHRLCAAQNGGDRWLFEVKDLVAEDTKLEPPMVLMLCVARRECQVRKRSVETARDFGFAGSGNAVSSWLVTLPARIEWTPPRV
jgi:hypothetical protein